MVKSLFNVIKTIDGDSWIYNTLTSSFIKIASETWGSLSDSSDKELLQVLHREGILVDDNETEILKYKYFCYSKIFNNTKLSLAIAPTMKCNFDCPYCFEGDHKTFSKMSEEIENALVLFIEKQYEQKKNIHLTWFGGEPLLAFDTILSICTKLDNKEVVYSSDIITNGSLLKEEIVEKLHYLHITRIQITLDGTADTHNQRRHYKNGNPSFDDIINNIDILLNKTDIKLIIQVGVDNSNPYAYQELYNFMHDKYPSYLNNKRMQIGCNNIRNRTNFDGCQSCFTDKQIFDKNIENLKENKYDVLIPRLPGLNLPCMFRTTNSFAIDSQGNIYKCLEYLGIPELKIGNVCEGQISFSKMANTVFGNSPFNDTECCSCNVFPICGGGCPIDRNRNKGKSTKTYCTYYKKYLSEMLPYLYEYRRNNKS